MRRLLIDPSQKKINLSENGKWRFIHLFYVYVGLQCRNKNVFKSNERLKLHVHVPVPRVEK